MITDNCLTGCTDEKHHKNCTSYLDLSYSYDIETLGSESIMNLTDEDTMDVYLADIISRHKLLNYIRTPVHVRSVRFFARYLHKVLNLDVKHISKMLITDVDKVNSFVSIDYDYDTKEWFKNEVKSLFEELDSIPKKR